MSKPNFMAINLRGKREQIMHGGDNVVSRTTTPCRRVTALPGMIKPKEAKETNS